MAKTKSKTKSEEVNLDRRDDDRRQGDRRQENVAVDNDRRQEPRRKVQRRRQIDPTTCERDYTEPEIEFMQALDAYKRANGRMFPTCSEILEVVRDLGYFRLDDEQLEALEAAELPVLRPGAEPESSEEDGEAEE